MAKDNRKILKGCSVDGEIFLPGQEDELEEIMTPRQHARLVETGSIDGDWNPGSEPTEAEIEQEEKEKKAPQKVTKRRKAKSKAKKTEEENPEGGE